MATLEELLGITEKDVRELAAETFGGMPEMGNLDLAKRIVEIAEGHTTKQILVLGVMLAEIRDKR